MNFRIINDSFYTYLLSTVTNRLQEVSIPVPSLNPSFNALDEDVWNATKADHVRLDDQLRYGRNFRSLQVGPVMIQRKKYDRSCHKETLEVALRQVDLNQEQKNEIKKFRIRKQHNLLAFILSFGFS